MLGVPVSLIIPVYNVAPWLDDCIRSVLAQTHRELDIILVDDGSTDSSGSICERYAARDRRIRVIHKENGGVSEARNVGLEAARGDWIAFPDADDLLHPEFVATLLSQAEESGADAAIGGYVRGENPHGFLSTRPQAIGSRLLSSDEALSSLLYQETDSAPWGKIFRAGLLREHRFRKGIIYEDLDLLPNIYMEARKVVATETPLYFYRRRPGSFMSGRITRRRLDVLDVTQRIRDKIAVKRPELLPAAMSRQLSANFNIFMLATRSGDKEFDDVAKECWERIRSLRKGCLRDRRVRLKNRVGILLSFAGPRFFSLLSRVVSPNP